MLILGLLACVPAADSDPATTPEPERRCNGLAELCERPLDQVAIAVAHNAMNAADDPGWALPNQTHNYERQVADGIRGFMLDVHDQDGEPTLCHGFCSLGSEPLVQGLARLRDLLQANPDDVFVLILQDEMEAAPIEASFAEVGLVGHAITGVPPWPTLGELIDADTRLLVTHERERAEAAPWYHATYELAWDNDYSARSVGDFDCDVLRGQPTNDIFLLNHFLTDPLARPDLAKQANPAEVIRAHVDACEEQSGQTVDWIAVDFYEIGGVLDVVDELNRR